MISTMAETFGGGRYDMLIRRARYLAFAALLPCPPLLIADLGRPERFHHMLRIFKPSSPMNTGAWTLAAFSPGVATAAITGAKDRLPELLQRAVERRPVRWILLSGLPFAIVMLAYPGVLLSSTSIPIWSQSRFLGPLIACSSMSAAAAALGLAIVRAGDHEAGSRRAVRTLEVITGMCEIGMLAAYLRSSRTFAEPLTTGRQAKKFWIGAAGAGIIAPLAIRILEAGRKKSTRSAAISAGLLTLAGGLMLKWVLVHAGRDSADDPAAAREAMRQPEAADRMPATSRTTD